MKIAILGAQGTGKTQLAKALTLHFSNPTSHEPDLNWAIADEPPLMAAVYADLVFNDPTRYDLALTQHATFDLTLLLGLDLPELGSGQTSPHGVKREAVDTRLRSVLARSQLAFKVIYGQGPDRLEAALNAILPLRPARQKPSEAGLGQWQSSCEKCSDPVCEHRLFTGRLNIGQRY